MKRTIGRYCKFTVEKMSLSRWWFDKFVDLREKSPGFTLCFFNDSMQCFCQHKHESIHQLVITWSDKHMLHNDKLKAQIKAHSRDESCKLYRRLHVEINRTIPKPNQKTDQCDHTTACSMNLTTHKPRALWDVLCVYRRSLWVWAGPLSGRG